MLLLVLVAIAIIGEPVISLGDVPAEEPVVVLLTTNDTSSAIEVISYNLKQQFPLPGSFTSTLQTCRNWQCPRQNLDLIQMDNEFIVAAPFNSGICLTKLQALENDTFSKNSSSTLLYLNSFLVDNSTSCTLLGFVNVSVYTAYCLQSVTLYSCGLTINITELSESHFVCELVTTFSPSPNPLSVTTSNFVLGDDFQVFFTHGDHLLETSYTKGGIRGYVLRETQSCSSVVYSRGTLYLFCDNNMVLMMDTSGIEIERYTLNGTGIPFLCEGMQASFTVRQGPNYTEIDFHGSPGRQTYHSNGTRFRDATCVVDFSGMPQLFLIDQVEGLFVANSSSTMLSHFPEACGGTRTCSGLFVYPGPYIVVLGGGGVATSLEMMVYGGKHLNLLWQVDLTGEVTRVGIYTIFRPITEATARTSPTGKATTDRVSMATELFTDPPVKSHFAAIIAGPAAGGVLLVSAIVIGVAVGVLIYIKKRKHSSPPTMETLNPEQETAESNPHGEPVIDGSSRVLEVTGSRKNKNTGNGTPGGVLNAPQPTQPSDLQALKAADAEHGYPQVSSPAQFPQQCSNKH